MMGRATDTSERSATPPETQLPAEDESRLQQTSDEARALLQRPSSGRTTTLGRRVEKPAPARQGGPSGQTDGVQHHREHANK